MRTATNKNKTWQGVRHAPVTASEGEGERVDCWEVAAFEESVAHCEDRAYRLAMHLVGSEVVAQEILQETFLSAWQNTSSFASQTQFNAWVYRATVRSALGRLKSTRTQEPSLSDCSLLSLSTIPRFWIRAKRVAESDWSILPAHQLATEDLFHHIRETVNLLPIDLRTVFVLCDLEELSIEDGAEILDLPEATALDDLHTARMAVCHSIGLYLSRSRSSSRSRLGGFATCSSKPAAHARCKSSGKA